MTNGRKAPQAETLTCTYFDVQDRQTTLNYPFPKQMKNGISLAANVDDNQSWVTLTDECERTFLRDEVTSHREGRTYVFQDIGLMSKDKTLCHRLRPLCPKKLVLCP